MRYLGLDLGTSFIKGAVLDLDSLRLQHMERRPFPEPVPGLDGGFREFDPEAIVREVGTLLNRLLREAPDAAGVVMCSQMHSLVLTTPAGRPLSRVINWQDQRALSRCPGAAGSYFDSINSSLTPKERRQLGNEPRPGVPLCFLFWLAQNQALPKEPVLAAALPSLVAAHLCGTPPKTDVTHAFAYGALDVETADWHREVIGRLGLDRVQWPEIVPQGTVVGEWRSGARALPVFAPVGDYHCAQVGAFLQDGELSINISTGSAVIQVARGCEFGDFQTRPWFDGRYLKTVTHIPGGRALTALVRLLTELAVAQGLTLRDPWEYILAEAERVPATALRVNPAFYYGPMGDSGAITHVREENLTVGHLFRAAFEGMAENYERCAARLSPKRDWERIVFSGGVALKIPLLRQFICQRLGGEHRLAASEEDTLLGLLVLSLAFSGRSPSAREAMAFARQQYRPQRQRLLPEPV
jgi:sugar (pentulose or hexulose) kinase